MSHRERDTVSDGGTHEIKGALSLKLENSGYSTLPSNQKGITQSKHLFPKKAGFSLTNKIYQNKTP